MKAYIVVLTLLICSNANGQDTALFNRIDSIVAQVNRMASKGTFDTLKGILQNAYPPGTTSNIFLLKQGGVIQKIFIADNARSFRTSLIFQSGKLVLRQMEGPSSTWNYYLDGETSYLYFKEDNRVITVDSKFMYDEIERFIRLLNGSNQQ